MNEHKSVKVLMGCICVVVIMLTLLNEFGVISKINDMRENNQMIKENRSWDSKTVGKEKFYLELFDYTEEKKELGDYYIGIRCKTDKSENFTSGDVYSPISDVRKMKYENVIFKSAFEAGDDGDISKNNYYYMILPLSCVKIKVGNKVYATDSGEINTKNCGKVKFNVCLFPDDGKADIYKEGTIVFYDKSGKKYKYLGY